MDDDEWSVSYPTFNVKGEKYIISSLQIKGNWIQYVVQRVDWRAWYKIDYRLHYIPLLKLILYFMTFIVFVLSLQL